jgi:phosphopantetheine adenylyltransferase
MNGLSDFLVESILDQEADKSVALFGGGFKPPTKGHLEVVNQGLKNNPEVSEVKILVGGGKRNGFTQDQAVKIWNLYNDVGFIDKPATIIPVSSPFTYYKEYLKTNPDDKVYVFIGSRPGEEKDQFDVNQRSEFVKKYSDNVIPVEVATEGGVSGTMARELFKTDLDGFRNMFPENLLDQDFDKIVDILNNKKEKSSKVTSNKTEPLKPINEDIIDKTDFVLPRGKKMILQAEDKDYDRGLIVELTEEGGYKMNYWYGDDAKVYPVEVEVDGESIKPDANEVYMKFHPELEKENIDPASQKKHKGKSAPFGSAYEPLNENATYSNSINYKKQIKDLTTHMLNKGMKLTPLPKVIFKNGDKENAENFFGKTAYYQPDTMEIVLYTEGRHPKDIVRSFAHEMIHHMQNLEGRLGGINTTNTQEDDHLTKIEAEAYQDGNLAFRGYTDTVLNEKKNKDPFGLNQFARELIGDDSTEENVNEHLAPQKEVRIFTQNCGCDKTKRNI